MVSSTGRSFFFFRVVGQEANSHSRVSTMEGSITEAKLPLLPLLHGTPSLQEEGPYTGNGSVDVKGNPASKTHTGKWKACYSILGGEFCGALAYYAVGTNLVSYLTKVQGQSNVTAASNIASWQGNCYLTTILGAFLADSYWGRHRTIVASLTTFTFGMVLLTLSAVVPPSMHRSMVISPQEALSSLGLYMTALGLGGIWPCVPTFGADQFDDTDISEKAQKELFYNWYYFAVNGGFFVASTVIVWVQDNCGWGLGFGIPTLFSVIGIVGFLASMRFYRYQKPGGSALTRICQVVVAAFRKVQVDVPSDSSLLYEMPGKESAIVGSRKLMHTDGLRFFDRAATIIASDEASASRPWKLCTVTQVEELKILARMLPVFLTAIIFNTAEACFPLFVEQGGAMDNHVVAAFALPPASLMTFTCVCILVLAPTYDRVLMPAVSRLTGVKRGLSELHRIGVGMVFAVLALAAAASVETARLRTGVEAPVSILWQAPQYLFVGVAKVFSVVGYIEFAYEQSPDAMRSLCQACSLIMVTLGSYLVSAMLTIISSVTGGGGWIPENLNEGHLDRFFWLMAALQLINLVAFRKLSQHTGDGSVDVKGNPASKHSTGCWRACAYFFVKYDPGTECLVQLAFFGVQYNLVTFLTTQLHQGNAEAARNFNWFYFAMYVGALLSCGCRTNYGWLVGFGVPALCIVLAMASFLLGSTMASLPGRRRRRRRGEHRVAGVAVSAVFAHIGQLEFFYNQAPDSMRSLCSALGHMSYLSSVIVTVFFVKYDPGTECLVQLAFFGVQYNLVTFLTTQLHQGNAEAARNFNWFYFAMYVGALLSCGCRTNYGWLVGFGVPALCIVLAMASFLLGSTMASLPGRRRRRRRGEHRVAGVAVSAVFAHIGQLEFFYNQAPDSMRSLCSALGHMSYLSSVIVTVVSRATARGGSPGCISPTTSTTAVDIMVPIYPQTWNIRLDNRGILYK
uniref:Uncharacterized protein n=1 Tax=Oryza punctata TaxID=4537 RepID=A0A0E0M4Z1_ORYPU